MVRLNVKIIFFYGQANRIYHEAARLFKDVFLERPVSPSYVKSIVQNSL